MMDYSIWPQAVNLPMITVPITMCLSKIATYTEFVLDQSLLLQRGIKYSELVCWYDAEKLERTEKESMLKTVRI